MYETGCSAPMHWDDLRDGDGDGDGDGEGGGTGFQDGQHMYNHG